MLKRILITGGACAGKTETIGEVNKYYSKMGYNVFVLNEVPTQLITNGVTSDKIGRMNFIELIVKVYLQKKNTYEEIVVLSNNKNNIIIYDGSPIDVLKFIEVEELKEILKKYNTTIDDILDFYDKIIFLETVAKKYPEKYSVENNKARMNHIEKAIERNDKLEKYYGKNISIIESYENFDYKVNQVLNSINQVLVNE